MVVQQLVRLKKMNSNFITNKGKRKSNQDVVFIKSIGLDQDVYMLADGMGGYKNGEYAANFIVKYLYELLKNQKNLSKKSIQSAIAEVTRALAKENERQGSNMGATLGGVIGSKEVFHCFWVGDVKISHVHKGKILFESVEHNLKNELIKNKVFVEAHNAKKYTHIVTRSIQNDVGNSKIGYKCITNYSKGDFIILYTDGVTAAIDRHQLLKLFQPKCDVQATLTELNEKLVGVANDNYSLICITK